MSVLTRRFQQPVIQGMRLFAVQTDSDYSILPVKQPKTRFESTTRHVSLSQTAFRHLRPSPHSLHCASRLPLPLVVCQTPQVPYALNERSNGRCPCGRLLRRLRALPEPKFQQVTSSIHQNSSCPTSADRCRGLLPHLGFNRTDLGAFCTLRKVVVAMFPLLRISRYGVSRLPVLSTRRKIL